MNERRARHLLPRPCGLKPHPFTPPLLPPTPRVIPAKAGIQRGCARAGHPHHQPLPLPRLPPVASFPRIQQPRGAVPGRGTPAKSATQRNRPHASSFPRSQQPRGAAPTLVIPAQAGTQRGCARAGSPSHPRDSRAVPAPHSDTGQEPRGARLEQGRPFTDRLEMPAPSYRRSRTCWDLPSTACCSRRPHSFSR